MTKYDDTFPSSASAPTQTSTTLSSSNSSSNSNSSSSSSNHTRNEQIARTFTQSWASTHASETHLPAFLSQYSPQIEWYDHAFFMQHRGHAGMTSFRSRWHKAIKDFSTDIVAIDSLPAKGVAAAKREAEKDEKEEILIRCIYDGMMAGDLPGRKASGKRFRTNVLIVLKIEAESGKIERVDEYYTATLDEGCDVSGYVLAGGRGRGGGKGEGKVERKGKGEGKNKERAEKL